MTITRDQYNQLGFNSDQINQQMAVDLATYTPGISNVNSSAVPLSATNSAMLGQMNIGSANPISNDAYSSAMLANGWDPSNTLSSGMDTGSSWKSFSDMFGGAGGIAGAAGGFLGGIGGIMQGVQGIKANQLSEDVMNFKKFAWGENNRMQAQTLNDRMKQRQIADIHQQGLASYTAKHGDPDQALANRQYKPLNYGA